MLFLVPPHGHLGCFKHQDVSSHEYRITVQGHRYALVRVFVATFRVRLHRRFVRMRAIHEALRRHARQYPGQLRYLWYVRLSIEHGIVGVHSQRQPCRRYLQCRLTNLVWIIVLRQRMIIGEKIIILVRRIFACRDAGADCTDVIADVRCARRGNAR